MKLLIAGAGGHGSVTADVAETSGSCVDLAFVDDRYPELSNVGPWRVVGRLADLPALHRDYDSCIAAFGNSRLRLETLGYAQRLGFHLPFVVHNRATVSRYAMLGNGCLVAGGAVVNFGARLGSGVIVNTGATVDHDCILDDGVHVCPGASVPGNVHIGAHSWFGIGAVAKQGISIGSDVVVGAGAVCLEDVADGQTVVGVPARRIK